MQNMIKNYKICQKEFCYHNNQVIHNMLRHYLE